MQKDDFVSILNKILVYTNNDDWRIREIAMSDAFAIYCANVFNLPVINYTIFTQFLTDPVIENVMLATDCLKHISALFSDTQMMEIIQYLQKTLEAEEDSESIMCYSMVKAMISLISSYRYSIPSKKINRLEAKIALLYFKV